MSRSPAGRPYYDIKGKVLVEDFSGAADNVINVTEEITDTVNVKTGAASRKFTGSNLKADYFFTKQPIGEGFGLWVHMPIGSTYTSFTIFVANDAGAFGAGNFASALWTKIDAEENTLDGTSARSGWEWITLKPSDFISGTPAVAFGEIDTIRVNIIGGPHTVTLDGLYLNMRARAKCIVMFDDAYDEIMGADIEGYMTDRDIKGTIYVTKDLVDAVNFVSTAELENVYTNLGWDVCNHLVNHNAPTLMTDADYLSELLECSAFLNGNGWTRGAVHHAYPTGDFERGNHDVVCENNGFKTARSIQATLINYHNTEPYNLHYLWSKGVSEVVTASSMTAQIDKAISAGKTCMFYFHGFDVVANDGSLKWATSDFQTVMDHLALKQEQGLIDSLTISEWYDGLENGTPRSGA